MEYLTSGGGERGGPPSWPYPVELAGGVKAVENAEDLLDGRIQ